MLNMEDFHVDTAKIPLSEVNYDLGIVGIPSILSYPVQIGSPGQIVVEGVSGCWAMGLKGPEVKYRAVSYTHLTLPTINWV